MTPEEAIKEINKMLEEGYDVEIGHEYADDLLCRVLKYLGQEELVEAYEKLNKWYA